MSPRRVGPKIPIVRRDGLPETPHVSQNTILFTPTTNQIAEQSSARLSSTLKETETASRALELQSIGTASYRPHGVCNDELGPESSHSRPPPDVIENKTLSRSNPENFNRNDSAVSHFSVDVHSQPRHMLNPSHAFAADSEPVVAIEHASLREDPPRWDEPNHNSTANNRGLYADLSSNEPPASPDIPIHLTIRDTGGIRSPPLNNSTKPQISKPSSQPLFEEHHVIKPDPFGTRPYQRKAHATNMNWKATSVPLKSPSRTPLRICPKRVPIDYAIDWYFHPNSPNFLICTNCYSNNIEATNFATHFQSELKSEAVPRTCLFHVERIQNILWPQALATGSLTNVIAFMDKRSQIKCSGTTKNNDISIKYYSHRHNEPVDGFIVCEACYEDLVLAKPFADKFQLYPVKQTPENFWACDSAFPVIQRAFDNHSNEAEWAEAVRLGVKVHALEACPGARSHDTSRAQWYKPIKHIEGFVICETCYYNRVVNTPFAKQFEFAAPKWQTGWSCDLSAWSVSFALDAALWKDDYNMFWNTANTIMHSPFCAPQDMSSEIWYTTTPAQKNFNVCPACYEGMFKAYNCGDHLLPQIFAEGDRKPVTCSMWRESRRAHMYMLKFCEAIDTLHFSMFTNLVTLVGSVPSCPRDGTFTNRYWYGYSDALFCQECYELFVKNTSLAEEGKLQLNFEPVVEAKFCSIYSPRMREKWLQACSSGDLSEFLSFAKHRLEVHSRTMPEMQRLLQMMQMKSMMSLSMGFMTMMTHAGDSISNMAGGTSESWSVTTSDGFHGTGGSEIGAQRQADFERSMAQASGMSEMAKAKYLNALWKAVE